MSIKQTPPITREHLWLSTMAKWDDDLWKRLDHAEMAVRSDAKEAGEDRGIIDEDYRKRAWHSLMDHLCGFCYRYMRCDTCPLYPKICSREYTYVDESSERVESLVGKVRQAWVRHEYGRFNGHLEDMRMGLLSYKDDFMCVDGRNFRKGVPSKRKGIPFATSVPYRDAIVDKLRKGPLTEHALLRRLERTMSGSTCRYHLSHLVLDGYVERVYVEGKPIVYRLKREGPVV